MNERTQQAIRKWDEKHIINTWNHAPSGLAKFCRFVGVYGFQVYGGWGWKRIHTLSFATELQNNRRIGGNWKALWKHIAYSK